MSGPENAPKVVPQDMSEQAPEVVQRNTADQAPHAIPSDDLPEVAMTDASSRAPMVLSEEKQAPEVVPQDVEKRSEDDISNDEQPLEPIDAAAERRLRLKCDLHVLPMLCIMYLLSFLDRVNIGNARIEGLEKELNMKGTNYNVALFVFFVSI